VGTFGSASFVGGLIGNFGGSYFSAGAYYDDVAVAWKNTVSSQGGWAVISDNGVFTIRTAASPGTAGSTYSNFAERLRIGASGQLGIAGANYGTSGQVLTSQGSAAAPAWTTPAAGGFSNMQVFTSNGTFTVPAGVTKVKVTVVGGGGGGGGANSGNFAGSGGAGGGAAIKVVSGLTPASTVSVTVGTGGGGSNYGSGYGGAGNTSSFGAFCSATGGAGGKGGDGTVVASSLGGIGSGGDLNIRGGCGTQYISFSQTGTGGSSIFGGGAPSSTAAGNAGGAYGGGAGGARDNRNGASGAAGVVIVEY
jgi:hypothetical protein